LEDPRVTDDAEAAVDPHEADVGEPGSSLAGQSQQQAGDPVRPVDRDARRDGLAPAVRVENHVLREQREQTLHVPPAQASTNSLVILSCWLSELSKRGRRAATACLALRAIWRQLASLFPTMEEISA
jgi:hypothetical protein